MLIRKVNLFWAWELSVSVAFSFFFLLRLSRSRNRQSQFARLVGAVAGNLASARKSWNHLMGRHTQKMVDRSSYSLANLQYRLLCPRERQVDAGRLRDQYADGFADFEWRYGLVSRAWGCSASRSVPQRLTYWSILFSSSIARFTPHPYAWLPSYTCSRCVAETSNYVGSSIQCIASREP